MAFMYNKIEMEQRLRQAELLQQAQAAKQAQVAVAGPVRFVGSMNVQSQFFMSRFGAIVNRLKTYAA